MTNKEVAQALVTRGYDINSVTRTDGSIRITRIISPSGQVEYSGAKGSSAGNNLARKILGKKAKLSRKQTAQRTIENKKRSQKAKKSAKKRAKKEKLSDATEKALRKAQRKLAKAGKKGELTKKRVKKHRARTGKSQRDIKKTIENIMQHELGYAYADSVADLIEYLTVNFFNEDGTQAVIKALKPFASGRKLLQDHIVADIYDIYYEVGKYLSGEGGIPPRQASEQSLLLIKNNI